MIQHVVKDDHGEAPQFRVVIEIHAPKLARIGGKKLGVSRIVPQPRVIPLWRDEPTAITLRTDPEFEAALTFLAEHDGESKQETVRRAVMERAERRGNASRVVALSAQAKAGRADALHLIGTVQVMAEFLTLEDVLYLAGDIGVGPVRDVGLLEAAAARPRTTVMGADAYPDLAMKAGARLVPSG